jgi:hypothetical protein
MSFSNYPNGFANGVTIRGMPVVQTYPGQVYWVNNSSVIVDGGIGGSNGNPGTYQKPFGTIDYAIGRCRAGRGDIVMVMPNHAESISSATSLVCDVAGVAIIGLGSGDSRPTLTFTTATTAAIQVSAANVTWKNIVFVANFADIAEVFNVTTGQYLTIEDCEISAAATNVNFLSLVDTNTTNNAADGLAIIHCTWIEPDAATLTAVSVDGDLDGLVVEGCYFNLGVNTNDLPIVAIVATGKDVTNISVKNNNFIRLNDANPLLITCDTTTANTGVIADNTVRHLDTAGELLVTAATNISFTSNLCAAVVDTSGFLVPAADS